MKYKLSVFEVMNEWWWSITDENGDEVADSKEPFATEIRAIFDGRVALSDWQ